MKKAIVSKKDKQKQRPGSASDSSAKQDSKAAKKQSTRQSHGDTPAQSTLTEGEGLSSSQSRFSIVAIGASAGGLEALNELFQNMPSDSGMAFVVVTHQHPGHASLLPDLLARETEMEVVEVKDGMHLKPDHVYVGPPGSKLALLNGTLQRMEPEGGIAPHLPIDYFFRSLAEDQQERAICIVLSGTGTDGTLGLKAIKRESGMAMVQQPQSAQYAGMPASAIATGLADYVLPPKAMPKQLVAYSQGLYLIGEAASSDYPAVAAEPMQKIFVLMRNRTGHDFSAYKSNTIRRRIERRMNVHQIKEPQLYVRYLKENPHEIDILFKELLISVTNFFRDADAWEAIIPQIEALIKSRPEDAGLRAWIPGCATGEEAYSLAILLLECMDRLKRHHDVQIFATDLDADAIQTARGGQYPDGIAVDVSSKRLERFFIHEDSSYRVRKEVREMVIFAPQNMIKDPPFTRLDILSCRNVLIYLNAPLQKKLLPIFHYALKPGGLLLLGPSETVGAFTNLFQPLDKHWKIFQRNEIPDLVYVLPEIPAQQSVGYDRVETPAVIAAPAREAGVAKYIERLLLKRFAPASAVIDEHGDILYIHGHTGAYLEPVEGEPRNNVLEMAREGLRIELAAALRESASRRKEVCRKSVRVRTNGDHVMIDLSIYPIEKPETVQGLFLVTFQPPAIIASTPPLSAPKQTTKGDERIADLERELLYMKESQQSIQEDLETSNEELKSSNEELQSTNEELQSTNEELETSKEEMQSLNEELTTVNTELQSKVDELSQSNDDMQNLLNSTDIATVFLDNELNIKRFTEQAKSLVMLRLTDVGRPISELASNLRAYDLAADCRHVLKTLAFIETEVETRDGVFYLMRIMPYRTADNVIDGLVLTFVDISRIKAGESARDYFESIVDTIREPLLVLDEGLRVVTANRAYYRTFRASAGDTEGERVFDLTAGGWDSPSLRKLLQEILPENAELTDYEVDVTLPGLGQRSFLLNARRLQQTSGLPGRILLAMEPAAPVWSNG